MWLQRYRLLVVIFTIGLVVGVREYMVTRSGATSRGPAACEASAASCFSIPSSSLATRDPAFWSRHAHMVRAVAELNPDDPDTEFLRGMQALAAGDQAEFTRLFEQAIAAGVKHNFLLLQFYAQYLLDSGADWERVNRAVNRWRENHPFSREPISLGLGTGPETPADEAALATALRRIPWLSDFRLVRERGAGNYEWRLHLLFRPGRSVDMRQAVAAVTVLSIPAAHRHLYEVTCRTLVDCTAQRISR